MTIVVAFNFPQDEHKYEHFLQASNMAKMIKEYHDFVNNTIGYPIKERIMFNQLLKEHGVDIEKL